MNKCDKCINQDKRYSTNKGNTYCSKLLKYSTRDIRDNCSDFEQIKYTNADKIKEMSNEELARILFSLPYDEISKTKTIPHLGTDLLDVVKWLESEVE